jgi:hypothetical protein
LKPGTNTLRFLLVGAAAALLAAGCGPKRIVFQSDPTFPLRYEVPVKILVAAPVDSLDLTPARDAVIKKFKETDKALAHATCAWGPGLADLAGRIADATELRSDVLADEPLLPRPSRWLHYESDALGTPRFSIDDPDVVSAAAAAGFDYVAVPQNLSPRSRVQGGQAGVMGPYFYSVPAYEELIIETTVAVVEARTSAIVWTGVVSSTRNEMALGSTDLEKEANDWLFDLLDAMGRNVKIATSRLTSSLRTGGLCD